MKSWRTQEMPKRVQFLRPWSQLDSCHQQASRPDNHRTGYTQLQELVVFEAPSLRASSWVKKRRKWQATTEPIVNHLIKRVWLHRAPMEADQSWLKRGIQCIRATTRWLLPPPQTQALRSKYKNQTLPAHQAIPLTCSSSRSNKPNPKTRKWW